MDKQAFFDECTKRMVEQGCLGLTSEGACSYQTDDGNKCGIGIMMSAEDIERVQAFETDRGTSATITTVLRPLQGLDIVKEWGIEVDSHDDRTFLQILQSIHDTAHPDGFNSQTGILTAYVSISATQRSQWLAIKAKSYPEFALQASG